MNQQVEVTVKLNLWLWAEYDKGEIATLVGTALAMSFGDTLTEGNDRITIISIREEAEIFGNEEPRNKLAAILKQVADHYGLNRGRK